MIRWDHYVELVAEDGVQYFEFESAAVTEDGRREFAGQLFKQIGGEMITYPAPPRHELSSSTVSRAEQRRIAVTFALPFDKYIRDSW